MRRLAPRETKLLAEPLRRLDQDGVFEGYASLFNVADLGRDIVMPGAFQASLARRGAAGIRMLWQHDPAEPIGRWLHVAEDQRGLSVRGRLNLAVERARESMRSCARVPWTGSPSAFAWCAPGPSAARAASKPSICGRSPSSRFRCCPAPG